MNHLNDEDIQDYLDGNLAENEPKIAGHLESCLRCRQKVKEYRLLYDELNVDSVPALSPEFADMVLTNIKASSASENEKSVSPIRALVYSVSGLLATLFILSIFIDFSSVVNLSGITALGDNAAGVADSIFRTMAEIIPFKLTLIIPIGLILLAVAAVDYVIRHNRQKPISYMI